MKIRSGFVSNSSASSFCVLGVSDQSIIQQIQEAVDCYKEQKKKALRKPVRGCSHDFPKNAKFCTDCGEPIWVDSFDEDYFDDMWKDNPYMVFPTDEYGKVAAAGFDNIKVLQESSIREAAVQIATKIKQDLGVDVDPSKIDLRVGVRSIT